MTNSKRKRLCILSMSVSIERDGRVLRQIEYLSRHFDIVLIGYGEPQPHWQHVEWCPVNRQDSRARKLLDRALLIIGRVIPLAYELWLWTRPRYKQILRYAEASCADGFHVNDWAMVPLALAAAEKLPSKPYVMYDIHEYWELEGEDKPMWRLFFSPLIRYIHHQYARRVRASSTVCAPIAQRYREEIGLDPILVYSAPKPIDPPARDVDPQHMRLVFHGSATRNRHLEVMIDALALLDERFSLNLMLVDPGDGYIDELKVHAEHLVPGRVSFHNPVPPPQIAQALTRFDIALMLIRPTVYNNLIIMPNKLFESMAAGLACVIGPSPAMAALIEAYGFGTIAEGFSAQNLAAALDRLTIDGINAMRTAARTAAKQINADTEMNKVIQMHRQLLGEQE